MKPKTHALGLALAASLVACGGGELLALLQIVTPLGGAWSNAGFTTTIQFTSPPPSVLMFSSKVDVTASVNSTDGVCGDTLNNGVDLVGTLENGQVALRPIAPANAPNCIQGSFTDLRKLDTVALGVQPARSYTNSRVDVQMQLGLWVSESGTLTLKFNEPSSVDNFTGANTEPVTGCDVSIPAAKVNFEGEMRGFVVATLSRPLMPELVNPLNAAQKFFTQVEYVDGATLRLLNAGGVLLTLKRKPNPGGVAC
ncbi:hypothetical protein [Hydrogenophaga sp.]|uniref:hypothetical protein n=1 Tax=Hydrogenophaga sp. TaxID=1904254 RepID=UPI00273152D2|nr:hypothetical protein [Hydrogenophaga sp.]MDP2015568.1 hypothetical protein [Hydrogenophaga sp.]MDP3167570.1 hypothetical protein [Hydrogenophaga sp.]